LSYGYKNIEKLNRIAIFIQKSSEFDYLCLIINKCIAMRTINYTERNMIESYSAILGNLSVPFKIELMERLLKSIKNQNSKINLPSDEFIPEKSAEEIIAEIRETRNFGRTRVIESQ
jgi:hypothetical protein